MEVFMWQVGILLGICLASLLFGKNGLIFAVGTAVLWTVVMIFTSWLMILQFATIFIGFAFGGAIVESPNHSNHRTTAWTWIIGGGVGIWWFISKNNVPYQQVNSDSVSVQPVIQPATPPQNTSQREIKPPQQKPAFVSSDNLSLTMEEESSLSMACSSASMEGPAAYNQCVQYQMTQLSQVQRVR